MSLWIKLHQGITRHRKIIHLASILGVHRAQAAGHMAALWTWALDNAPDGDLSAIVTQAIGMGAEWDHDPDTFTDAAVLAGLLDRTAETLTIHNWLRYAGKLIEGRERDAERKRRKRAGRPSDVHRTSTGCPPIEQEQEQDPDPSPPERARAQDDDLPGWLEILRQDSRWPTGDMTTIIANTLTRIAGSPVDLEFEAVGFVSWLTGPKGKRRKNLPRSWTHWLGTAVKDSRAPASNGRRISGPRGGITPTDQLSAEAERFESQREGGRDE